MLSTIKESRDSWDWEEIYGVYGEEVYILKEKRKGRGGYKENFKPIRNKNIKFSKNYVLYF